MELAANCKKYRSLLSEMHRSEERTLRLQNDLSKIEYSIGQLNSELHYQARQHPSLLAALKAPAPTAAPPDSRLSRVDSNTHQNASTVSRAAQAHAAATPALTAFHSPPPQDARWAGEMLATPRDAVRRPATEADAAGNLKTPLLPPTAEQPPELE
jgi:hypothetical protein